MPVLDEPRLQADARQRYIREIRGLCRRPGRRVQLMEVCGTHTVSIFRSGVRSLLPDGLRLLSGPGCPVCVTAQGQIDAALELAGRRDVLLATYGDMLRVPGRSGSLERHRAAGARVQVINNAMTALRLAQAHPDQQVVLLGVGFETTAPATAATVLAAERAGVGNFSVLVSHRRVVPAMQALLADPRHGIDGFLCPGHVSVIIGTDAFRPVVERFGRPCVVAGFEPTQLLRGIAHLLRQIAHGRPCLENVYTGVVTPGGNRAAQRLLREVFVVADTAWRELGVIPASGLELAPRFARFDAARRFGLVVGAEPENPVCRCGQIICGRAEPPACPLFGNGCTPLNPIGPCMVSSEGACAAWYRYARNRRSG